MARCGIAASQSERQSSAADGDARQRSCLLAFGAATGRRRPPSWVDQRSEQRGTVRERERRGRSGRDLEGEKRGDAEDETPRDAEAERDITQPTRVTASHRHHRRRLPHSVVRARRDARAVGRRRETRRGSSVFLSLVLKGTRVGASCAACDILAVSPTAVQI